MSKCILISLIIFSIIIIFLQCNYSSFENKKDYIIAIPSYNRVEKLGKYTLSFLKKHNIDNKKINIFVANKEEYKKYKKAYPNYKIIIGIKGIKNIRNFITNYYEDGRFVLNMDDDIENIINIQNGKMKGIKDFDSFVKYAFNLIEQKNIHLWGISTLRKKNTIKNMPSISLDLNFISGTIFGVINDKDIQVSLDVKDDVEMSIKSYEKYGNVLRFNHYCPVTKYRGEGGMESIGRTNEHDKSAAEFLMSTYPHHFHRIYIDNYGITKLQLKSHKYK